MKITIDKKCLDDSQEGGIQLEAAVFAFKENVDCCEDPDCKECGKPAYLFFIDTKEYDELWKKTTRRFKPTDDWGRKLQRKYKTNHGLEQKLSMESKYQVPKELLQIQHARGGGHGDLRLRYIKSCILFFPLDEFGYFKREYSENWNILEIDSEFSKRNPELLKKYNIEFS